MNRPSRSLVGTLVVLTLWTSAPGRALGAGEYSLPTPGGVSVLVTQGNATADAGGDHTGPSEFAWDLAAPDGSTFEVAAARAGIVSSVRSDVPDGNCPDSGVEATAACWTEANHVVVDHLDGTAALYLHLAQGSSAQLAVGDPVVLGQVLGLAGSSGTSGDARLHFMVMSGLPTLGDPAWWRQSIPVSFADESVLAVHPDGVPGEGVGLDGPYVSGNPGMAIEPTTTAPIARPDALPVRLPWAAGETYSIIPSTDPAVPGGFGFEVVSDPASDDVITSDTLAYPLFSGLVRYAGCATGASAGLGRIVVVERDLDGRLYQAIHAHLSSIDPSLAPQDGRDPLVVSADQPIGTFGSSVSSADGACDGEDGRDPRLLFTVLEDALVGPAGQIGGGTPVEPGPFVGFGAYEVLPWWQGPMRAIAIGDRPGLPSASWAPGTTTDRAHVFYGGNVALSVRASGAAPLREVRFLARYEDWPVRRALERFPELDPDRTWRIVAVCRPPGVRGEPRSTRGCRWVGGPRRATVSFSWDPNVTESRSLVPWLPRARAAITEDSAQCVPATFTFEVFDASGYRAVEPRGRIAFRCDAQGRLLGRMVSLDPPAPPAAPRSVRLLCTANSEFGCTGYAVTWRDYSGTEKGFRVYAQEATVCREGGGALLRRRGPWLVATLRPGSQRWDASSATETIEDRLGEGYHALDYRLSVSAWNDYGETPRVAAEGQVVGYVDVAPC